MTPLPDPVPEDCGHHELVILPEARRLQDSLVHGGRKVTVGWHLTLDVSCATCGQPMRWLGVPAGVGERKPGTNLSGTVLFAPLIPGGQRPGEQ